MQVKTILNRCHKFKSFVYDSVRWTSGADKSSIEVTVLTGRGSKALCSLCGRAAPLYDHLDWRRYDLPADKGGV